MSSYLIKCARKNTVGRQWCLINKRLVLINVDKKIALSIAFSLMLCNVHIHMSSI